MKAQVPPLPIVELARPAVRGEALDGGVWLVELIGECDLVVAKEIAEVVDRAIASGSGGIVVDLGRATLIDCAALGALLSALQPIHRADGAGVVLTGARGATARVLHALGLDARFELCETRARGVTQLLGPGSCEG